MCGRNMKVWPRACPVFTGPAHAQEPVMGIKFPNSPDQGGGYQIAGGGVGLGAVVTRLSATVADVLLLMLLYTYKCSSKHWTLMHCWYNVEPASATLAQHCADIGCCYCSYCCCSPMRKLCLLVWTLRFMGNPVSLAAAVKIIAEKLNHNVRAEPIKSDAYL